MQSTVEMQYGKPRAVGTAQWARELPVKVREAIQRLSYSCKKSVIATCASNSRAGRQRLVGHRDLLVSWPPSTGELLGQRDAVSRNKAESGGGPVASCGLRMHVSGCIYHTHTCISPTSPPHTTTAAKY